MLIPLCPLTQPSIAPLHRVMIAVGNAARLCANGEWQMAQVLQCDTSGFVNALSEVRKFAESLILVAHS